MVRRGCRYGAFCVRKRRRRHLHLCVADLSPPELDAARKWTRMMSPSTWRTCTSGCNNSRVYRIDIFVAFQNSKSPYINIHQKRFKNFKKKKKKSTIIISVQYQIISVQKSSNFHSAKVYNFGPVVNKIYVILKRLPGDLLYYAFVVYVGFMFRGGFSGFLIIFFERNIIFSWSNCNSYLSDTRRRSESHFTVSSQPALVNRRESPGIINAPIIFGRNFM